MHAHPEACTHRELTHACMHAHPRSAGVDDKGNVANEVESEQIVWDGTTLSHAHGLYCSFLTLRGSVPVYWAQEHSGIKAKPPIVLQREDPFYSPAALHFSNVSGRPLHTCIVVAAVSG